MAQRHGISPEIANDALADAQRVVIEPDYNSKSGRTVRVIGFSILAGDVITVIALEDAGTEYRVNGWPANEKDRRIYHEGGIT